MELHIHNNTVLQPYQNTLVSTYVKAKTNVIQHKTIPLQFKGSPLCIEELWSKCIAFFMDHPKNEVQLRGYYHPEKGWRLHAFPQEYPKGMNTKELADHPNFKEDRALFDDEWTLFMSIHHHCSTKAFQSGVDHKDELSYPGLHITLGELDKPVLDWHARVNFANSFSEPALHEWFYSEKYPFLDQLPMKYQEQILKDLLTDPANRSEYPQRWKDNLIKPEPEFPKAPNHFLQNRPIESDRFAYDYWENDRSFGSEVPIEDKKTEKLSDTCVNEWACFEFWIPDESAFISFASSDEFEFYGYKSQAHMKYDVQKYPDRFVILYQDKVLELYKQDLILFDDMQSEEAALDESQFIVVDKTTLQATCLMDALGAIAATPAK